MKKWALFSILLFVLVYIYKKKETTPLAPSIEKSIIKDNLSQPSETKFEDTKPKPLGSSLKVQSISISPKNEKNNLVTKFKVVEDAWAVAHGDWLLGKVDENFKEKEGFAELPVAINPWNSWTIPYAIENGLANKYAVEDAIEWFHRATPFEFVYTENLEEDALFFIKAKENCYSYVGRVGGPQPIMVSPSCGAKEIAHEIMHSLGFIHEQSREDRDQYVEILWPNIKKEFEDQFKIISHPSLSGLLDFPFDYHSIMLYDILAFTKPGAVANMLSLNEDQQVYPNKDSFSQIDIEKLRQYFQIF